MLKHLSSKSSDKIESYPRTYCLTKSKVLDESVHNPTSIDAESVETNPNQDEPLKAANSCTSSPIHNTMFFMPKPEHVMSRPGF